MSEPDFTHCKPLVGMKHVADGWGCCKCRTYNGEQRATCRNCSHLRCSPQGDSFEIRGGRVITRGVAGGRQVKPGGCQ